MSFQFLLTNSGVVPLNRPSLLIFTQISINILIRPSFDAT